MPKIQYIAKRFSPSTMGVIEQANAILEEYSEQGFTLTLRQLYYQFVARDLIANTPKSYDRLGRIVNNARLAGLIDWNHLEDRLRNLSDLEHFSDAADALLKLAGWYHIDFWERQEYRPEVWIEKDALAGVIEGVCQRLDVPFFCCRGYTSQSEMWRAARRLEKYVDGGQVPYVFHFGDHDPSGVDMSRDIFTRLMLFTGFDDVVVSRIALNMNQVNEYDPPPNPAKVTDSRAKAYIAEFGSSSWELDALEPSVLVQLIEDNVSNLRDVDVWNEDVKRKQEVKQKLTELAKDWN